MQIEYVANGMKREVRDSVGQALIDRRLARPVYQTRMMQAEPVEADPAPYGYKADGTPRKRRAKKPDKD